MKFQAVAVLAAFGATEAFQTPLPSRQNTMMIRSSFRDSSSSTTPTKSPLFSRISDKDDGKVGMTSEKKWSLSAFQKILARFNTIESAELNDVRMAGIGDKIKNLHGPKTYLVLSLLAGLKWKWCFRSPYYWFAVAFCVKWYRARYVFKIPVWDRQPNWNNIVTSKEQEKDLKAFTCLNCGSTLFIAKTREFFFEGDTGIGGLGCFSCGVKGKENFVMDRDRIVEDVADMDDYFEYERPLDFVSRAERRKVLKEAGGDEEKANELLLSRAASEADAASQETATSSDAEVNGDADTSPEDKAEMEEDAYEPVSLDAVAEEPAAPEDETPPPTEAKAAKKKKKAKKPAPKETAPKKAPASLDDDDLDVLDMD